MDRQVIQVIGPARGQTRGLCVSNWYFDVPHSFPGNEGHKYMRDTQAILAGLLNKLLTVGMWLGAVLAEQLA